MTNMKLKSSIARDRLLITVFLLSLATFAAHAQQINGTPGSPSATTTIDGKQLPPEPPKFGGVIKENAKVQAILASVRRAAQRRAKRPADHDR